MDMDMNETKNIFELVKKKKEAIVTNPIYSSII